MHKNPEKFHASIFGKTLEMSFQEYLKSRLFPKKLTYVNLTPLCNYNFMQKIEKVMSLDFSQNSKNLILSALSPLLP